MDYGWYAIGVVIIVFIIFAISFAGFVCSMREELELLQKYEYSLILGFVIVIGVSCLMYINQNPFSDMEKFNQGHTCK